MAKAKKKIKGKLTSVKTSAGKPSSAKATAGKKAKSAKAKAKPAPSKKAKLQKSRPAPVKKASDLKLNKQVERPVQTYNLFEDLENQELMYMLSLKPAQRFAQLRSFIKTAYSMKGYDPDNMPGKRSIRIIEYKGKPI